MAPKAPNLSRRPSKEKQVRESSSSEEEEPEEQSTSQGKENSSDETEEGSTEEEEEEDGGNVANSKPPISVPISEQKTVSKENGSDSEPDSDGSPSNYKMQPIRKPSASSAKRAGDSTPDPSRSSKKPKIEEKKSASTPSGCITRLWSNADEIAVLNGIIDFKKAEGLDPNSEGFYNFIKGKLQTDFSKDQLRTKISRLKKRFLNASKKGDPVFSKPHEDMAFELSKRIWGDAVNSRSVSVKNESAKKDTVKVEKVAVDEKSIVIKETEDDERDFWSRYPYLRLSFDNVAGNFPSLALSQAGAGLLKDRVSLIGNVKAKEFDEKWKQLILEQTELNHKMLSLMTEQVRMALNQ